MAKMGELKTNILGSIRRISRYTGKRTETGEWPAKLEMRDQHARHQKKYSHTSPKPRVIIYFRNKYNCPPLGRTNVATMTWMTGSERTRRRVAQS